MSPSYTPLKQVRTNDTSSSSLEDSSGWVRHPELYFPDGSMVLLCDGTLFKVSGAILAINAEIFKDMMHLESDQPVDAEMYDGCPCVRLSDKAKDMEAFLKALLIVGYIPVDIGLPPYEVLEGTLRLATKYMAHGLRSRLIYLLSRGYHTTLHEFVDAAADGEEIFSPASDRPHPNRILNLFRECGLVRFLPFAFYQVCTSLDSIFAAEEGNRLSHNDLRIASAGLMRLQVARHTAAKVVYSPSPHCTNPDESRKIAIMREGKMCEALADEDMQVRFWNFTGARMPNIDCCRSCMVLMKERRSNYREQVWTELPAIFGLPAWDNLSNDI